MKQKNILTEIEKIKKGEKVFLSGLQQEELINLVDIEFLKEHAGMIDVGLVFKNKKLKDKDILFFARYANKNADFLYLSIFQKLSDEVISRYQKKLVWSYITTNQSLSLNAIKENISFIQIDYLPYYQREVTADFLKKNRLDSGVAWKAIASKFILDEDFILEYFEFMDNDLLRSNPKAEITDAVKLLLELS